jgi:protoporphyrinogen oxidase
MSPKGQTSLMVEIPCQRSEPIWHRDESALLKEIAQHLIKASLFREDELLDACIYRVHNAYPILEKGYLDKTKPIYDYLSLFHNLHLTGRNGLFAYTHIHDHMVNGRNVVNELSPK